MAGSQGTVPLWIMETGYACLHDDECAPGSGCNRVPAANYTEDNQALYYRDAFQSTVGAGLAQGFLAFGAWPGPGVSPPPAPGYTAQDEKALTLASACYLSPPNETAKATEALAAWALENAGYVLSGRLGQLVGNVTNSWGTFRADRSPMAAAEELRKLYSKALQA